MKNFLAALLLLLSSYVFGQAVAAVPVGHDRNGNPATTQITVCNSNPGSGACGSLATIFTDGTLTTACNGTGTFLNNIQNPTNGAGCSNPGFTDAAGNALVFAAPGTLWCQFASPGPAHSVPCPSGVGASSGGGGGGGGGGGSGNQLLIGGGVEWVANLQFTVGAATYLIAGIQYTSALTNITLSAADPTNGRFDVIYVDNTGTAAAITGTPSPSPSVPTVDPTSQLLITPIFVPANSTTPQVTKVDIYHENTEWTTSKSGTPINLASTNNPYDGTKDIEATATVTGNFAQATDPQSATVDMANYTALVFYLRSKATWPATRTETVQWYNGATAKGTAIVITGQGGQFGFDSSITTAYQQISIPTSLFGINGIPVTSIRFTTSGTNGGTTGWYLDDITLQGIPGQIPPGGTVTLVNTASPLTGGPIRTTGTVSCPTCAIGPGSSTANHVAEFSGTDGVTLKDGGAASGGTVTSVTFTGDGVVDSSTPSSAVTTSGTVTASIKTQTANTELANVTSGTAAPAFVALPSGGTNGCSGTTDAAIYTAGTGWGCHQIPGGTTTVTTVLGPADCTADETGNVVYDPVAMTHGFDAGWRFVTGQAATVYCAFYVPHALAGTPNGKIILDIRSADSTASHTANFLTGDFIFTASGTWDGSFVTAANQTYTTTSTAWANSRLTYTMQSTLAADGLVRLEVVSSTTGTNPASDMWVTIRVQVDQSI